MSRRVWGLFAVAMVFCLVLAGCATPATPPPAEGTPAPEATPTEAAPPPTEGPGEPKVATFIMWQDFIDLDPAYSYASEEVVTNQCYENLVWYNPPGSDELLSPGLATSWEANEDATEWTFHLREGVTFQDGTPFTADAVKANIERYLAQEGAGCTWIWDAVEEVEVVDDYTVKLHLSYSAPMDLISTATFCGGMMSPAVIEQPKEWFDAGNCVGTGPYTIESYEKGQRLVMTRFEDYWGGWQANQFDKIVYEIVTDTAVAMQMMEQGEADFWRDAPPDQVARLEGMEGLQKAVQPSFQHMMFMLNTAKEPTNNKLVRQALAYSFPYDQYLERTENLYTQSRGGLPQGMWGWCEDCPQYTFDLDKARDLLAQAGYPDGGFELELTYMGDMPMESWAVELWTFPLADLGITLKPQPMTFESLWELAKSDPATAQDITTFVWWPTWVTPYDPLWTMYHCEEEPYWNVTYWCNPEFDQLLDEGNLLTGTDISAAADKFIEAQHILVEESPAIFVCDIPDLWIYSADIEGFQPNPAYPSVVFFHNLTTTR
jgi:peptide/nickel transport system substrate-binding protein